MNGCLVLGFTPFIPVKLYHLPHSYFLFTHVLSNENDTDPIFAFQVNIWAKANIHSALLFVKENTGNLAIMTQRLTHMMKRFETKRKNGLKVNYFEISVLKTGSRSGRQGNKYLRKF